MITKSGLRIVRNWLSYSEKKDIVYCLPCWIFPRKGSSENPWGTCGVRDWKHLSERIKSHETSDCHLDSCTMYETWRKNGTVDIACQKSLREEQNFWRKILQRILDVTMMLATCNLAFRGSSDNIEDSNKGNFLSVIDLLAKYDPVLSELLARPAGSTKYLSYQIQNEVINLLGQEVYDDIIRDLKNAPFFSIILDTTQDSSKIDQLSQVFRFVHIVYNDRGEPIDLVIDEVFTSFTAVKDQSASGLETLVSDSLNEKCLNLKKCRGQAYDGAAVMSGEYSGLQQRIKDVAPHAHFVHCATHNLNLVLKDAVSSNRSIEEFFETVQSVYDFFGNSISRWEKLQSVYESGAPTLKTLNPTRFSGRYDAVHALKQRFCDILKCLSQIILKTKKSNERNMALGIQKKIETFDFVFLLVLQDEILQIMNLPSKLLQSEKIDLFFAHDQLQNALQRIQSLRENFNSLLMNVSEICDKWKIEKKFLDKRSRKVKSHFDELSQDERLNDPQQRLRVNVFYPMIDTILSQLESRFVGMKNVLKTYKILQPQYLTNSSKSELEQEADLFSKTFSNDVSPSFSSQLLSVRSTFSIEINSMKDVKELARFLMIQNASLSSSYPDVCTALLMFLTVPITTAKAERTFSKLKLIKNYLRTSMGQNRLSNLALLSIENQRARKIDFNKVINNFSSVKSRKKCF